MGITPARAVAACKACHRRDLGARLEKVDPTDLAAWALEDKDSDTYNVKYIETKMQGDETGARPDQFEYVTLVAPTMGDMHARVTIRGPCTATALVKICREMGLWGIAAKVDTLKADDDEPTMIPLEAVEWDSHTTFIGWSPFGPAEAPGWSMSTEGGDETSARDHVLRLVQESYPEAEPIRVKNFKSLDGTIKFEIGGLIDADSGNLFMIENKTFLDMRAVKEVEHKLRKIEKLVDKDGNQGDAAYFAGKDIHVLLAVRSVLVVSPEAKPKVQQKQQEERAQMAKVINLKAWELLWPSESEHSGESEWTAEPNLSFNPAGPEFQVSAATATASAGVTTLPTATARSLPGTGPVAATATALAKPYPAG